MMKQILVGGGLILTGAVLMGVALIYGDEKVLDSIKRDIDEVVAKAKADGNNVGDALAEFMEANLRDWKDQLQMRASVDDLMNYIESAGKK